MTAVLLLLAANDSAVMGVGGTVEAFDTGTTVRMVSEHIQVDFARRRVEADFVFENLGEACSVMMGFPEEGGGDFEPPTPSKPTHFESFQSWVDGVPAKTEVWKADFDEMYYKQWWTKTVDFAAKQTRRVRNVYVTRYSSDTLSPERMTYVLGTGRAWHGTIGTAKVVFDIGGVPQGHIMLCSTKPTRRSGNLLAWEYTNFEPQEPTFALSVAHVTPDSVFVHKPGTYVRGIGYALRR